MENAPGDASRSSTYLKYFGLREPPFGITPDPAYLFACRSIEDALRRLAVGVANGEGMIKLTGEVGTGKTLVCRKLLAALDAKWRSIYIPNPAFDARTLYLALAEGLGVGVDAATDQHHLLKAVTRGLLDLARQGKRAVLCVDEGQAMPPETLEALRLITNLETQKRKLLQVVLVGQPELDAKLALPAMRQILQRITFQHHMGVVDEGEVGAYVQHRMTVAGFMGDTVLPPRETRLLYGFSGGIPRLINVLMHKALFLACGEGVRVVQDRHLEAAASDTPAVAALRETSMTSAHEPAVPGSAVGRMLRELDRRDEAVEKKAVPDGGRRSEAVHEWFWRTVAGLLTIAIGWIGWVAYELQPVQGLATEQAFRAADDARARQAVGIIQSPVPPAVPVAPPAGAHAGESAVDATQEPRYALKIEPAIFTPIAPRTTTKQAAE
jgi:MSHA biogenesis protein MshM